MEQALRSHFYKKHIRRCSVLIATYLKVLLLICIFFLTACSSSVSRQTPQNIELGKEYRDYRKGLSESSKSKAVSDGAGDRLYIHRVASYFTDRLLDVVDIVKVDVGFGPAWGVVARVTPYGQVGYRSFSPASLRVGLRGRRSPITIERVNEFGIGPGFFTSPEREVSILEVGAGADVFLVGAYAGVSIDGLLDFFLGFLGIDISEDDGALYRAF